MTRLESLPRQRGRRAAIAAPASPYMLYEDSFDRITRLVARLLDAPVALLWLIDDGTQSWTSQYGLSEQAVGSGQVPRTVSLCRDVAAHGAPIVVAEVMIDPLDHDQQSRKELKIAAYIGAPIRTLKGEVLGALCAIDVRPRSWSVDDLQTIQDIAAIATNEIELGHEIDERRRAEESQQLLIRELHHRVRNTLATVQAVVQLSLRNGDNIEQLKQSVLGRVAALARVHTMLVDGRWNTTSLREIISNEMAPYHAEGRIAIEGPQIRFSSENAVILAMVIHELATNAAKYGALSIPTGRVRLEWTISGAAEGNPVLLLDWIESGGPVVKAPVSSGLGTTLLHRLMAGNFNGTAAFDYRPEGLKVRLLAHLQGSLPE